MEINQSEEKGIDLKAILRTYLSAWKYIALSVAVMLVVAFVYLRYSVPNYQSVATILIKEDKGAVQGADFAMLKDLGLGGSGAGLENEVELYQSRTIVSNVVKKLKLNRTINLLGDNSGFVRAELYAETPISIEYALADSLYYDVNCEFNLQLVSKDEFVIKEKGSKKTQRARYGSIVKTAAGPLIIKKSERFSPSWISKHLKITFTNISKVTEAYKKSLQVETLNKDADILRLVFSGPNIEKNNAILNELILAHDIDAIKDKNEIAINTSSFITERMKFIAAELSTVEEEGEKFKTKNKLTDLTSDAAIYLEKEGELEKKLTDATIQQSLADFMSDYIRTQQGYDDLLPANLGFSDLGINTMTEQYNTLVLERTKIKASNGERNPQIQKVESQLGSLKSSLEQSLRNLKSTVDLQIGKLQSQENIYRSKISSIPQFEREYRDIIRQQQIKETLYLFLLQKREENEISLASTIGNTKVIDHAYSDGIPVSPKRKVIFLGFLLVGLFIPVSIIYVKGLLNNTINGREEIEALNLPVIVEIPLNVEGKELVAYSGSNSGISEAFRLLRTNLNFVLNNSFDRGKVIFVTSTIAGEGKTFVSLNLANTLALSGRKTVLVGLDLRKPKLHEYLNQRNHVGVSNYIVNPELTIADLIIDSPECPDLKYIVSGDIPPNPSELILRDRLDGLISQLRNEFDYIIVDNAPVGLVADAMIASRFADISLYLVRANYLDKNLLHVPQGIFKDQRLRAMQMVVNGVDMSKKSGGYGYGYGHEHISEKRSLFKRIFKRK